MNLAVPLKAKSYYFFIFYLSILIPAWSALVNQSPSPSFRRKATNQQLPSSSSQLSDNIHQYVRYWDELLISDYKNSVEELRERRKTWSKSRLEATGMSIFHASAEPDSEMLGEKIVRIYKKRETKLKDRFTRGDVLLMTPDKAFDERSPIPKEILVMDVGEDWITAGCGPSWPSGLWESRKFPGAFKVLLERTAPQAPLKAQRNALERLRKGKGGMASTLMARTFFSSNMQEPYEEVSELPSYYSGFSSNKDEIENEIWKAIEKAKGGTNRFRPNQSQQDAIAWALQRSISLIRGPPGTGKTRVAALLISSALKLRLPLSVNGTKESEDASMIKRPINRILAVTHSNGAADVLLEALLQMGVPAVRSGRPSAVSSKVQHRTVTAIAEKIPDVIKLRHKANDVTLSQQERMAAGFDAKKYMNDVQEAILNTAPVVVTSCIGAHQLTTSDESEKSKIFELVVLDEAAQTTEPALVCALAAARAHQVVLIGDTKQLPPTITSMDLRDNLGISPMARLEKIGVGEVTLRYQYRMPPLLLKHPSRYFYHGLVTSGRRNIEDNLPPGGFPWPSSQPLAYINIGDDSEVTHNFGGRSNPTEAEMVVNIASDLLDTGDIKAKDIAIISPYSKQVQLIRTELSRTRNIEAQNIRVGTVDSYQGQETGVVIFSAVRSNQINELGFLRDSRRLCVAITRARRGLILIGDRTVLRSCKHWAALLDFCEEERCVVNAVDLMTTGDEQKDLTEASISSSMIQLGTSIDDLFDDKDDNMYNILN